MIRREQQRFSLRKYKVGVASVFLGTTLSFLMANGSAVKASEIVAQRNPGENTELIDKNQSKESAADVENTVVTESSEARLEPSTPEVKPEEAKSESTEAKSEETKAEKTEEKTSVSSEAKTESSKPAATSKVEEVVVAKPKAEEKSENKTEEKSESKADLSAVTEASSLDTTVSVANVEAKPLVDKATLALAAENTVNAGTLATDGGRRRNRRAATDHNAAPIDVLTTLADNVAANPDMTDPNGASVHSQTIPAGYQAKEGDFYTFGIWDLTRFNARYNTNYYARAYKTFGTSTDTTVELIDKNTGNVVETHTVTATSGVQKFTTTTPKSNNELTLQVDYQAGAGQGPGKTDQPFIQMGFEVSPEIQALVAPGHELTPAEQARFKAVYEARNSHDILNAVEPTYNGREVTDTNFKIPVTVDKTTYYKVVDQANPTYKETGKSVTTQDYKENGNETSLATYTLKAMEGQNFTASGERQFTKTEELTDKITRETAYKLYQTAGPDTTSGYVSRPYTVGTRFMDAERAGIKRIKEIVDEDGTVVIRVYLLDPKQQSKRSDGTLNTDGYMLLAETKPIKPGKVNTEDLVVQKTPLYTIPFTTTDGVNYPNGKETPFGFQTASGYIPKKTVFVPFLGDNIGHLSPNVQLERGNFGIGTNVDLLNGLTPYKQPIYYYDKSETIKVKPEVEKQLEGRALVDGEFSFKIKENFSSPGVEETVTNKDGKATFSELSFTKEGTYTYTITEAKGADKDVDYDAMEVTMTVKVTKDAHGDLQAEVKYSGTGGFASSADDKVFNNYVVAPVKTKFDFSKVLAGRELKAGEFSFVLKDSTGKVLQTKTNTKEGVVAFDDLTFDKTQVGTHKYTVEEVIPTSKEAGMTYDTMKAEVTITVTKEGHLLKATNTLPADREFNNSFTPAPVKVNLEFDKSLSNGTLNAGDFSFTLTGDNNVSETVTNKANGKISFSELSFDRAGVYNYTVKEVKGNKADVDYDAMTIAVKVTVTKDATTGLLSAKTEMTSTGGEATGADDKVFNNHVVAPVTAQFDFSKALAGRKLKAGEFSFVLKDSEGTVLQTKQNDVDGKVKFDALTFTNAQVGDHKYTVEEVIPETKEAGMTYDTMKANVTVSVTKSGHALTAVATLPQDKEFNNTFTPAATQAQFKFTKRLEGKELTKDAFTFELLENGNVIQTKKNAPDGTIQFDAIAYDQEGTHTYTVREVAGADTNIDYDSMNAVVTVTVTKDAATGLLSAKVNMPEDTEFNNYVVAPVTAQFDFSKALAGRALQAGEFSFVLKNAAGEEVETVTNKEDGTVTFTELSFDNTKVGTHTYTVEEVIPASKELGMTYDTMKATITVEVSKKGHALTTVTNVTSTGGVDAEGASTDGTADKEFNNKVTPPETPQFQPEKFVLNKEKFDITGTKLVDDDDELTDEYTATNANPYADGTSNNEAENINTKTVERGDKLVYQVWLDTTKFTSQNNVQYVGISDKYDAEKLTVEASAIKAYDGKTGLDVTDKFDITVENGVITATSKKEFVNGDNVIDTTKFAFGRYYKFDIPATVKDTVKAGADIENSANQIVHVYNPVSKTVEKPEKPTQKRVNTVPVTVDLKFTKKLEGRTLTAGEFSFVLKKDNVAVETVKNDAEGKITFKTLKFGKDDLGKTYTYTVSEVAGTDSTVTYDDMVATVTIKVAHDGTAKAIVASVTDAPDKEFNNKVIPPDVPQFQPKKYVLDQEKFDIKGGSLLDDDEELQDEVAETNKNPYVDGYDNNEEGNINTYAVRRGDSIVYQVWLDTTKFDLNNKDNIQTVGITDDYDETNVDVKASDIKAYDSATGLDITDKFDIKVENGVMTATLKAGFTKSLGDAENTQVIDTTKFEFGRYYKFDIPATVKADVEGGVDIENTAAQIVHYYNPTSKTVEKPNKPTQKRVNSVPIEVELNFTKKLEGRTLKAGEFTFELRREDGEVIETVKNDKDGKVKFESLEFMKGDEGTHKFTIVEVPGTDATVTYDPMEAEVTVEISYNGKAKALVKTVTDATDKEFNNVVTPPEEPKFQPEKYVVSEEKFDITGDKLLDDDKELADKYADTNANPYADDASNNEAQNLNTKTVKPGAKLVYQVWLDTTKFDAANKDNIQTVSISDNFDETKVDVDASAIKAYDSVTGDDVTDKFDIKVENGVMTATLKAGFTKSLGDAENTQVIDTTKFAFGRYYKFDIPATVKTDVAAGADIENTAAQVVNYYNPTTKKVEKPNKPTEKRVNSVPISVDFNFTKKLEGRELKAGEFTFELRREDGEVIERVKNDKDGKVKFESLEFMKGDEGTHKFTIVEVPGTDATVTYDPMEAEVTVEISYNGKAKALVKTVTDATDKEFNNVVTPPEEPKFQPEKYVVTEEKFDITGDKLLDDDKELADKYGDTNKDPYADKTDNNEAQNLNTKTVKPGAKLVYQVWLDTTKFDVANKDNIQSVSISDDFDETKVDVDASAIKAYDSVTGADVTDKFDIKVEGGVMTATLKAGFTKSLGDAENTQVIDTTKFAFGRYYKFDIPATVKTDVAAGVDIENTAAQVVNYYNPTTKKVEKPSKPTEKRVNSVPVQVEFNFTKRLEGRELKAGEFSFVLKAEDGTSIETVQNDKDGNVKFKAIEYKKGQEGTYKYTIEEVKGSDATVTYDSMKAEVTVVVEHNGKAKALVKTVTDATDKEFNNVVTPPEEPKFQPEKYVVSEEKFDITGDKLLDDDSELTDKYGETNTNPYVDGTSNNEAQNLNTKTVKPGAKLVYQVWLDTTKFDADNKDNIQTVSISDDFDETKVDVDASAIKAYDSVTGNDVTDKFDIKIENGVMTATLKAGFTKSLGDAENTQIIDTTKFAFGRYYKFDIPATVKTDVAAGVDIENTAAQVVNYYNPTTKKVEKPEKPTEKRVNSVPISVDFNFTKKLEGRELKAGEFSFVLKDAKGKEIETVQNDKDGNVKFKAIEYKKGQEGTYKYTIEEVKGTDATVTYDSMKAEVTVVVEHNGKAKALVKTVTDATDKEFNNVVTPPEEPKFQPEKYVVTEEKFDITGDKLLDDDKELADKVADTNSNPYADAASNNEAQNLNTKTVKPGAKLVYQVWLDTTKFDAANKDNIQTVGISDDYDETKLDLDSTKIKAYDSVTGDDVTAKFDITVEGGVITATLKAGFTKSLGDAENTQIIDTTKFAFGRYYKFDIPATVKTDVAAGADIENTAAQVVNYYNPTTKKVEKPEKPTEKRVNSVPISVDFNFTKKLEGRELKAGEFSFVLKAEDGTPIETVQNDKDGNVKFKAIEYKKGQEGTYKYTIEEVKGSDATVTYDSMKAEVTVVVEHNGKAKALVKTVTDAPDKEFNNTVTPPEEPKFQPEKYVVSEEKFDITGDKLLDDDSELTDKYGETNTNPYVDGTSNNEAQNLNTKTVKSGAKLVYQVWLDTTKFDAANKDNIQSVSISDDFDEAKVNVDASAIKAYDSVTGADVTDKFDIKIENGVMTATLKAGFTKSLGDAENTQIIDTTKFAFGRYYKFDIPATVKADVAAGADIENTAAQVVNYYNPTTKKVEKPEKPTEKRVNSVPISVDFNFTKKLEGRELKAGEFSFVLKDAKGKEIETVQNDKDGNVKFKAIEYKKGQEGTYKYTIKEVKGSDATVTYDPMEAEVTVEISYNGTAKVLVATVGDIADKEFNNRVTPPEEPKFQPEKYVVSEEKFDITGDKLVDDDKELADKVADTNANPYADDASNNEAQNLNTKTVKRGDKLVYQVWLDTTKFDAANKDNIQSVGISDDYDETKLELDSTKIKAYDSVTGDDVTAKFDITVEGGVITATLKAGFTKSLGDAENTQIIDTTKFAFGRYYKFDIPTTVKADVAAGVDIENTAAQVVNYYNPTTKKVEKPSKPTEKRVNSVPVQVEFNFTKRLEGRELKANEFSFVLKDSTGKVVESVTNDASGNVKFSAIEFKKEQAGVHNYTVEEVAGTDATVTYDTMKANVTVTVSHDGTAKVLVATVGDIADKEFNNVVTPPEEPKFQPEKYVVTKEQYDITGDKLLDDDKELADKVADTNANPYADDASNNEAQNLNTKTVKRGDKLVYQVWLDTTKFDAANKDNIQSVGISDDYDETKLELDATKIKAYDSVTGDDVTAKFDITVEGGVITATLKAGFTKSLGDAENTQVIDTTKFAFGRYYKFDIPTTVKADVAAGVDIENTAAQVVNYYNPTTKKVEKPSKPTEKRVNSVPISVEFNFTKRLEGRELKANEFSFVLKAEDGTPIETVQNDKDGNVKFKAIEYKKGQEGTYKYTIEEVKGTDATVTYDSMKAEVTVVVEHNGKAKALVKTVIDATDKEFNNTVRPPEEPKFQPEKYVVSEEKFDITGDKLVDDDKELADKVADTNANPYADDASNNEAQNLNTKTVKRGDKLVYQVWLDTTQFDAANKDNIQSVGISDDYDETKLDLDATKIKAYDSVTGDDVTAKFDIVVNNGVITATLKAGFTKSLGDAENTQVIDTTKFAFGRYYKFDIPTTVKADVTAGVDIENTAAQVVNYYNPTTKKVEKPSKPTEKRVNSVPVQVEFNFTKRLEGRELKANEFSFVLKDSTGKVVETVTNDASGNVKFSAIEFKKEQAGVHNYTVEEVAGTDATVTYDTMKANVTVTVSHDGTAKVLVATVGDIADKEFNNTVRPPEIPEFNPEKYILNESKFDLTGVKLLDDDSELKDKVADTNANPYADGTANNEVQNINTKTLKKGDKVYYQVWLDTTKFTEAHNIQSVGVTDKYDSANLNVNGADIKAYDSATGEDVTAKFDIKVENGVITATSKADLTKSLGDAENTQVIDTTKLAFGRYYKFEIPAEIKQSAQEGVDIENTASQIVHQYDPTKKSVEKPEKPTEKRVVNIPVKVQFQFTKKFEGRELKAGEFSFVLKDEKGNVIETVTNDAAGKIQFSALEFKRGEEGTHLYHVEEIRGTDSSVVYDKMVATVGIVVKKDGKVLVATTQLSEDTEFNNKVTPPTPPTPVTPPTPEKPKGRELPNTGEKSTAGVAALGAALGLAGLGLVVKRKKEDEA